MFNLSWSQSNRFMLLVTLFALFIGLYNLGDMRIGSDELKTLTVIKDQAPFDSFTVYHSSNHIPYVFLMTVVHQLTDKLYPLRLVAVIFGVLAVVMTYRLAKALLMTLPPHGLAQEKWLALALPFFLIITPLFTRYFREMRGYSSTVFFGTVMFFSLWQALTPEPIARGNQTGSAPIPGSKKWYWLSFIIASVLCIYTHFFTGFALAAAALLVGGEWLSANKQARHALKPFILSLAAIGLLLVLLLAPLARQILAVPSTEELSAPEFGPFAPTWQFLRQFAGAFRLFSPLGDFKPVADLFLGLVLLGCGYGLINRGLRRSTIWLMAWWLIPFLVNLITLLVVPAAQIRYYLLTVPAYLLLGLYGLVALATALSLGVKQVTASFSKQHEAGSALPRPDLLIFYGSLALLMLVIVLPRTGRLLASLNRLENDQAWTDVGAYLRAEVQPEDIILCEAFELTGGDEGKCSWHLNDLKNLSQANLAVPYFSHVANFRGAEKIKEILQGPGRVWFVLYFRQPAPAYLAEIETPPGFTITQFGRTRVIQIASGDSLLANLMMGGEWLLQNLPDEDHQFRYHLDLAQLYALAGDQATATLHLEQAAQVQQQANEAQLIPELRTVAALVRFYAPAKPEPQRAVNFNFDDRLKLSGYSLEPAVLPAGRSQPTPVNLSFYWQVLAPLEKDYSVFVHLKDGAGNIVSHLDFQPFDAIYPTSYWPVGVDLREARQFSIPGELPPGEYTFMVGLYLPDDMSRLRVVEDVSGESTVKLGTLIVGGS